MSAENKYQYPKLHNATWPGLDGCLCMFSNETMLNPQTWNNILSTMIAVRNAHGWNHV